MIGLIFGVTFAVCGLCAILLSQKMSGKDRAIARTRAHGRIVSSQIETIERRFRDNRGFYRNVPMQSPVVKFTYVVDGRELQGDRVSPIGVAENDPVLDRYPVGQEVMVHYDPGDPTIAYLEYPLTKAPVIISVLGGSFLLIGLVALVVSSFLG